MLTVTPPMWSVMLTVTPPMWSISYENANITIDYKLITLSCIINYLKNIC
jgi:hypothetical protein